MYSCAHTLTHVHINNTVFSHDPTTSIILIRAEVFRDTMRCCVSI